MKFNVEVDLEDLFSVDEYGYPEEKESLEDAVKRKIIDEMASIIQSRINSSVDEKFKQIIADKIADVETAFSNKLNELMEDFINKKITTTDRYGDVVEKDTSIKDILKNQCDHFLDQKVNDRGETLSTSAWGYRDSKTRVEYILNKQIDYQLKSEIESAVAKAVKKVKEIAQNELNKNLTEKMVKAFNMENAFDFKGDK